MNTPRTDANDLGWQFNEQYGDFDALSDTPMPWLDFSKMLEEELTAVTEQRDRLAEAMRKIKNAGGTYDDPYDEFDFIDWVTFEALQFLDQPNNA